jgi:hypothetical protein
MNQRIIIAIFSISIFLCTSLDNGYAQPLDGHESLSPKQAQQLRKWLAQGKSKSAFEFLGNEIWCKTPLVQSWNERKNMALAADLGAHARQAGKLEQSAHCTLSVIPRSGTMHNAAALYELSKLARSMGPDALLAILLEQNWAKDFPDHIECSEWNMWERTPHRAAYCSLVIAQRAPEKKRPRVAQDMLIKHAAVFAPRRSYLRFLPKTDRAKIVKFGLTAHTENPTTMSSEKDMWVALKSTAFGGRRFPHCSALKPYEREQKEGSSCEYFSKKLLKKSKTQKNMALLYFKAGKNEVGSGMCEENASAYIVPRRFTEKGVRYIPAIWLGYNNYCGTGATEVDIDVRTLQSTPNAFIIQTEGRTTEGASASTMKGVEVLCQQHENGEMNCLSGSWYTETDMDFDSTYSTRMFPRLTLENGRIQFAKNTSGDFWFKEYKALQGLTVEEAVDKLPEINALIKKRYVELKQDVTNTSRAK